MHFITWLISIGLFPFAVFAALTNAFWRWWRKETNIGERLGLWGDMPANVIWLHGASVGECLSLRPLLTLLSQKSATPVLLTTTTVAARSVMSKTHPLVRHQVWDIWPLVALRIKRMKPLVYVTVESEIWPVWLWALSRCGVPIMLLNARLSVRTMARWRKFSWLARLVFSTICYATTTCKDRAEFLKSMGVREVEYQPHLKYMSDPLPINQPQCDAYKNAIGDRPVWMAASVHPEERSVVINAAVKAPAGTLSIIAPRHIHTVDAWCQELAEAGLKGIKHSQFTGSVEEDIHYIMVDAMGELPVFYSLAPVVLVGGNLVPGVGGHNIIEPGMFGCGVLWGPYVDNCRDVCDDLAEYGFPLGSASELPLTVHFLLSDAKLAKQKGEAMQEKLILQQESLQLWAASWVERIRSIRGVK